MVRKVIETITSDLSGGENAEAVKFGLEGIQYEIDLTTDEISELRATLEPYVSAARRVRATEGRIARRGGARLGQGRRSDLQSIREWARHNGWTVADRGRVHAAVIAAYDAAHKADFQDVPLFSEA